MRSTLVLWFIVAGCSATITGTEPAADGGAPPNDRDSGAVATDAGGAEASAADAGSADAGAEATAPAPDASSGRGFPAGSSPWVSFYGGASGVDLAKVAATFRVINIDVDPDSGNFTDADIQTLRAGGKNRVISYMNVGSCEMYRSYWNKCQASGALTTAYDGYPDEKWANLGVVAYQDLVVNEIAPRLAARGVDGFFLDNMEVVEHGASSTNGPCDAACSQGGLDLVWRLRQSFPTMLIVMQNATSDTTRLGKTHGVAYPSVLDGISHEEVYAPQPDATARAEMLAWKGAMPNGFWIATEDYVGACAKSAKSAADAVYASAAADGFIAYVTDASDKQSTPCFWSDF